jgi:two-component system cell cycle response regulator DivK
MTDQPLAGWTVLIVDDDADNLGVAAEYLQFIGASVHTALDGIEGLAVLEGIDPTVILLDLSMPNMDGWQMLRRVRKQERTRSVPVIALTAHAMTQDRERVFAHGFNGYITKPFMLATLLDELKRWVTEAQSTNGSSTAAGSGVS